MTGTPSIDAWRRELILTKLRLPGMKTAWVRLAAQTTKEGLPAARFLAALAEEQRLRACERNGIRDRISRRVGALAGHHVRSYGDK